MADPRRRDHENSEVIEVAGPWKFVTRRTYRTRDGNSWVWRSRHHRKRLATPESHGFPAWPISLTRILWQPCQLNWWIGIIFALGSALFALGSLLFLVPSLAQSWGWETEQLNGIFFAGSLPFTTAAYLQLFQAANAGELTPNSPREKKTQLFGWRPRDLGWLSCALQFVGTVLFNFNTFDALIPGMNWLQQDLAIWIPDLVGSVLFLISGYFAFTETCHSNWAWKPRSISWWVTFANLLGCIAFLVSAFFAFIPPRSPGFDAAAISVTFTLLGAMGFLAGSLLMLPETAQESPDPGDT